MTDHTREPDAPGDSVHPDPEAPNWTGDPQPDDALADEGIELAESTDDSPSASDNITPVDPPSFDEASVPNITPADVAPDESVDYPDQFAADSPADADLTISTSDAGEQLDVTWSQDNVADDVETTDAAEASDSPDFAAAAPPTAQDTARIPLDEPVASSTASDGATESTTAPPEDSTATEPDAAKAASASGPGFFARLGLGERFRKATSATAEATGEGAGRFFGGARKDRTDGFRGFLDPSLHMPSLIPHTRFVITSALLALFMLMANSAGAALIVLSAVVPILIIMTLTQHDVFEKESNLFIAGVTAVGVVVGGIIGWLSSVIVRDQWFDGGEINFGAGGFGGRFAEAAGNAPFLVTLLCGLVLPAAGAAGIGAVPIVLRRWPQFRNEVMDGMIMAGASAAGYSIGLALVMWWPMITGDGPQTSVSDWTYMVIGSVLLRPIVITLSGAMIGAGVWRYMMSNSTSLAVVPAVGGILGLLLLTIGSVQLQSVDMWAEFLWIAVLAVIVFAVYRKVLDQAIATDQQVLGQTEERVVCPNCRRVTPVGAFCALCGKPLPSPVATGEAEAEAKDAEEASEPLVTPPPAG